MAHLYSTNKISKKLIDDLTASLSQIKEYGSLEVYVQEGVVTQISVRTIKKTKSKGDSNNTYK